MNEILGTVPCPQPECGETASVMQARRKGAHLYTRCPDCGLNQGTGKKVQEYIWKHAAWKGDPPTPPANIDPASLTVAPPEEKPETPPVPLISNEPDFEDEPEPVPAEVQGGAGFPWVKGLLIVSLIGTAAALRSAF